MQLRLVAFFTLATMMVAQTHINSVARADQLFKSSSFVIAAELYLVAVKGGDAPNRAIHNLAECYRQM